MHTLGKYLVTGIILFSLSSVYSARAEEEKKKEEEETTIKTESGSDLKNEIKETRELVEKLSGLSIGGFFDVSVTNYKNNPNAFALGDFELDIEREYKENFQVAAALVFNDEGAELAAGFVDYHLVGSSIAPRGRLFSDKGFHIQFGKFDVPFGNDWQYFASADRIGINAPLTTELVMEGGYNDVGARILANFVAVNATVFMLRGVGEANSYGGRIGITPFRDPYRLREQLIPKFELGFSYIHDLDRDGKIEERCGAVDFESNIGPLILRGEYYVRVNNDGMSLVEVEEDGDSTEVPENLKGTVANGYQGTAAINFSYFSSYPLILYGRYEYYRIMENKTYELLGVTLKEYKEDNTKTGGYVTRIVSGININIFEICILKVEYLQFLHTYEEFKQLEQYSEKSVYGQLVITF